MLYITNGYHMAVPQQKFREIVFQLLYSLEMGDGAEEDVVELLMKELAVSKKTVRQALDRVHLLQNAKKELDAAIAKASQSYAIDRIQSVEKNILRLGVFELFYGKEEVPPKVAIAEAMRLARKFGTPESASFVNAVLDSVYKSSQGMKTDDKAIGESLSALQQSEQAAAQAHKVVQENSKKQHTE